MGEQNDTMRQLEEKDELITQLQKDLDHLDGCLTEKENMVDEMISELRLADTKIRWSEERVKRQAQALKNLSEANKKLDLGKTEAEKLVDYLKEEVKSIRVVNRQHIADKAELRLELSGLEWFFNRMMERRVKWKL